MIMKFSVFHHICTSSLTHHRHLIVLRDFTVVLLINKQLAFRSSVALSMFPLGCSFLCVYQLRKKKVLKAESQLLPFHNVSTPAVQMKQKKHIILREYISATQGFTVSINISKYI